MVEATVQAELGAERVTADEGRRRVPAFAEDLRQRGRPRPQDLAVVADAVPAGQDTGHEGDVRRQRQGHG